MYKADHSYLLGKVIAKVSHENIFLSAQCWNAITCSNPVTRGVRRCVSSPTFCIVPTCPQGCPCMPLPPFALEGNDASVSILLASISAEALSQADGTPKQTCHLWGCVLSLRHSRNTHPLQLSFFLQFMNDANSTQLLLRLPLPLIFHVTDQNQAL